MVTIDITFRLSPNYRKFILLFTVWEKFLIIFLIYLHVKFQSFILNKKNWQYDILVIFSSVCFVAASINFKKMIKYCMHFRDITKSFPGPAVKSQNSLTRRCLLRLLNLSGLCITNEFLTQPGSPQLSDRTRRSFVWPTTFALGARPYMVTHERLAERLA